ncbi:M23 family metallopeptidase [Streptomyces sp. NPDC005574]|uniref:M23 family metallopeptidase n=1 Tax=Streptomyces sp. NPDC005574 TaxID=3156891 RepID=UPI0033B79790
MTESRPDARQAADPEASHRQDADRDPGEPEQARAAGSSARAGKRGRRGPGLFTLLVLPGLTALVGVSGYLALTGGLSTIWPQETDSGPAAAAHLDPSYLPWLRKAASACTVVTPSLLAAQIDQLSGWHDGDGRLSGEKGIAGFTDARWRTWGKDDDGNGHASPRDPADAIMALGRQDCSLAGKVTDLRTDGTVNGDLVDLTLAAYAQGTGAVIEAGRVPPDARVYVTEVKALLPRYRAADQETSGGGTATATGGVLVAPLNALTVTSPFGSRVHPLTGVTKLHTGVDFAAAQGTRVTAAAPGRVVFAALTKAYGNRVVVDHGTVGGRRLETTYSHLSALQVTVGQAVQAGTPIGLAGSTGLSTGPHLHFEVIYDGRYTDPLPWLSPGR